jgi:RNA polymerase primary sigma factor
MRQLKITKQITNREDISFNKYLTEVGSIGDIITAEEEIELTKRIKQGDIQARNKLCKANLRFVISVAKQYNGHAPLPDLVNEGNIGLIKAAEKFDETKGFKFISYAVWWIRQAIMQYLAEHGRMVRLPLNKIGTVNKVKQAVSDLEQVLERQPSIDEISEYLTSKEYDKGSRGDATKFKEDKLAELLMSSSKVASLDAPMTTDNEAGSLIDVLPGHSEFEANHLMDGKDLQVEMKRVISTLKQREQDVLIYYFGLFGNPQMSLEEIGLRFELTRERVRQIKEQAIRRLKGRSRKMRLIEYR